MNGESLNHLWWSETGSRGISPAFVDCAQTFLTCTFWERLGKKDPQDKFKSTTCLFYLHIFAYFYCLHFIVIFKLLCIVIALF